MKTNPPLPIVEDELRDLRGFSASGLPLDACDALRVNGGHQPVSVVEDRQASYVDGGFAVSSQMIRGAVALRRSADSGVK